MSNKSYAVELLDNAKGDISSNRSTLSDNANKLHAVRRQITHIIKMVCPKPVGDRWDSDEYSLVCRVDATYCEPSVTFYAVNLDSFKDKRLEAMLWFFSTLDGSRDVSTTDYAVALNRVYRFQFNGFMVRVDATVKSDSPTCRKVVVKSEMVKKDVYAIQCD